MKTCLAISICLVLLPGATFPTGAHAQGGEGNQAPGTIEELRTAILEVLQETGTPAAGIALVDKEGAVWVEGLGEADRERGIDADKETLFRIASTSKIFVALAILKLQEQGKLRLKDSVKDLIPEIEFKNPWEETNPILVEHLLEHTTGWDDIHLAEATHNEQELISLREALALHPHSRISRWVPGTRMAYANSGPAVAAYIVEKISGQPFEAYVQENLFAPMSMETMTYSPSKAYQQKGATLYKGGQPQAYLHISMRPSGAINATPKDMAKLLQLFVQRGKMNNKQLFSEAAIRRMETPSTTSGAKAGLKWGYGLGLYTSDHRGFTYYKHGGGIGGGVSDFSYLPEGGVGYSVQINADNPEAIRKISKLIRDYQTQQLPKPERAIPVAGGIHPLNGYYQAINPRNSLPFSLPPLLPERIWTKGDTIFNQFPAHVGQIVKFVSLDKGVYHNLHTDRPDVVVVTDPLEGEVLELAGKESGTLTLGRVPAAVVWARVGVLLLWILLLIRAFLLVPIWAFRYWKGRLSGGAQLGVRIWPLLPLLFLGTAVVLFAWGMMGQTALLAKPSPLSVAIMLATIGFFATAVFAVGIVILYKKKGISRAVWLPAAALSALHLLLACYFAWHGVIGLMTWA